MKLAIMQPYFLPYLGYFQHLSAVDRFIVYDDVNYINRGWINRNNILMGNKAHMFTVPLQGASQNKLIYELEILHTEPWQKKFLKTLQQAYQKAPQFSEVFPLIEGIVNYKTSKISELATNSITEIARFIGLSTDLVPTAAIYNNNHLRAQDRILDICQKESAKIYINPIGGMELYDKAGFKEKGIALYFIKSSPVSYKQLKNEFVPWLSMIDVLMFNNQEQISELLGAYELI